MTEAPAPPPHAELGGIAFLLGTWRGEGEGRYPTIDDFAYGEELRIGQTGKPFVSWAQRTWSLADGRPLHVETGYLRATPGGRVELVLAHPTGVAELAEGEVHGATVELSSRLVGCTSTAKPVTAISRRLEVDGDLLRYSLSMAAVGRAESDHLSATLRRVGDDPT
jgi:hypothetical protein